jgi:serine protease AprX
MKKILVTFSLIIFSAMLFAQNKYWIEFTDKANVTFDPYSYFSQRTIEQRIAMNISLNDSTDYPVNSDYVNSVSAMADSLSWSSRWLNGVAAFVPRENISSIKSLPFVRAVTLMNSTCDLAESNVDYSSLDVDEKKLLKYQTERLGASSFAKAGFDGTGIRIAVFDAGFPGVDKNIFFSKLRNEKKIIATYDFVCKKENVYSHHWHGAATLSCIVGMADTLKIGMATGAEVLLARTERAISETYAEEENWLAAVEWADKNGANIISSSLGYTHHRYFNTEMNGNESLIAKAATIAASKGMLVVNSAGNDGADHWHFIDTPGDADSVLTVGATDPKSDMHIYFSSYGPASDGTLKPNVCATGVVIALKNDKLASVSGTSFSAPLVSGFAACAWQAHRQWTNMELFNEIEKSASLYPYFDYAHGFGVPVADHIITERGEIEPTFDFVIVNDNIKVVLREKYSYSEEERALGYETRRNFYYKIEDKDGIMKKYFVLLAENKEMMNIFAEDFTPGDVLTVHFEGYTNALDFPEIKEEK